MRQRDRRVLTRGLGEVKLKLSVFFGRRVVQRTLDARH
jgi:hypothetical protein